MSIVFDEPPYLDPLVQKSQNMAIDRKATKTWWIWFQKLYNIVKDLFNKVGGVTVRITSTESPYTVVTGTKHLMCDTDGGAITVIFLNGFQGQQFSVYNVGDSGNNVTLTPASGETIKGESTQKLFDDEVYNGVFDEKEYWR